MKYNSTNNVIQLYPSAPAVREGLDFAAVNRRATLRFRAAERRRNVVNAIESAVTALIGVTKQSAPEKKHGCGNKCGNCKHGGCAYRKE